MGFDTPLQFEIRRKGHREDQLLIFTKEMLAVQRVTIEMSRTDVYATANTKYIHCKCRKTEIITFCFFVKANVQSVIGYLQITSQIVRAQTVKRQPINSMKKQ